MTKEVLNISFVLFTFFDSLVSGICPEFFLLSNVQNLSTFIYPEFIQNFGIQNLSSFICSVYVQHIYRILISRICPVLFIQYISRKCIGFFSVQNMSSFICPENIQNFFYVQNMSRRFFCVWINSGHEKFQTAFFINFLDIFWTFYKNTGYFLDIYRQILDKIFLQSESVNMYIDEMHSAIHDVSRHLSLFYNNNPNRYNILFITLITCLSKYYIGRKCNFQEVLENLNKGSFEKN